MKPYDDLEKLVSPKGIQAMCDAVTKMQESIVILGKAINDALGDPENPNHEIVKNLISEE